MKIFNQWNAEKQLIHIQEKEKFYINPREIWYTKMGINIGFEQNGKHKFLRPVLVLKIVGNLVFTVALTTKGKKKNKFYYHFKKLVFFGKHKKNEESSFAILSQVKVMDKNRFIEKIGYLQKEDFYTVQKKLKTLLF